MPGGKNEMVVVTSEVAWTTKGIDYINPTITNATTPFYKFPSLSTTTYSPDWYCADFCKYISSIIKI